MTTTLTSKQLVVRNTRRLAAAALVALAVAASGCGSDSGDRSSISPTTVTKSAVTSSTETPVNESNETEVSDGPAVLAEVEALGLSCKVNLSGEDSRIYDVGFALRGTLGYAKEHGEIDDATAESITSDVLSRFDADADAVQYLCTSPDAGVDMSSGLAELDELMNLDPSDPQDQARLEEINRKNQETAERFRAVIQDMQNGGDGPTDAGEVLDELGDVAPLAVSGGSSWVGQVVRVYSVGDEVAWVTRGGEWAKGGDDPAGRLFAKYGFVEI